MRFGLLVLNLRFFPVAGSLVRRRDLSAFGPDYHLTALERIDHQARMALAHF